MKFLSLEQKEFYKENGYVKLGNILSTDESDRISDEYSDLFLVSFIEKLSKRDFFLQDNKLPKLEKMPKYTNEI